ncbi:hypothetical protein [Flavobacterium hungaricum]|uniref:Uncharacterized protein n=1 Tax=Flavobacterium hungaricum TaxID=2082725 RepID=A0ABR9TRB2_9FLAO|nr:hypothetical protein [Flavobacterium hungaricum]MBE8727923.1 hypothetical protein [Flavobacterium hungaricum]
MAVKVRIAFIILTLGFFLIPIDGFACGNSTPKTSEKKQHECCKKECCKESASSKKKKHNCDGKCNHTNCTSSVFQFNIPAANIFDFETSIFNFSIEKPITYYNETNLSDGFTSIWLRPKIT